MKRSIAGTLYKITSLSERLLRFFPSTYMSLDLARSNSKLSQMLLMAQYSKIRDGNAHGRSFQDVEFRAYSQNGEDGILLYIFSLIGFKSRQTVEICAGDGIECNTANLIVNHSCYGLLIDGDRARVEKGRRFYRSCSDTSAWPPKFINAWITRESINSLIAGAGFEGEVDLLSIDIDGMDYWLWREIDAIQPRVVVIEFNHLWGAGKAVTVPYDPAFQAEMTPHGADYHGASLSAMIKLGREKGYRFVGCEKYGFNAFFLRDSLGLPHLPEMNAEECFNHPRAKFGIAQRFPNVALKQWEEV
jgi:hypothetical protein